MKRIIILVLVAFFSTSLTSQVAFIISTLPDYTPDEDLIYLAGDLNGWDPGNPDFVLVKNSEDKWEIILPQEPLGTAIQFKFTRGDWGTVEKGAQGEEIANREFVYGNGDTIYVDILNWADNGGGGSSTAAENVSIMDDNFYMPQLYRNRRIWIYLPPAYDIDSKNYPVLYMHDGQNLFDNFTSYAGEWEIDETLNELYDEGYQVPIVVGIDNGGAERINEYTPWVNLQYGGGQGSEYMEFLVNTLKPHIDENYRTLSDRENTGIMGSSLGGLISQYGALVYQDIYSKSGIFSPAYWISDSVWAFTNETGKQQPMKFYQLIGTLEGSEYVVGMWQMDSVLHQLGFGEDELFSMEDPAGNHNEVFWRDNFRVAYLWMFGDFANSIGEIVNQNEVIISPNPVTDMLNFELPHNITYDSLKIIDTNGKILISKGSSSENSMIVSELNSGTYILVITTNNKNYSGKFVKK